MSALSFPSHRFLQLYRIRSEIRIPIIGHASSYLTSQCAVYQPIEPGQNVRQFHRKLRGGGAELETRPNTTRNCRYVTWASRCPRNAFSKQPAWVMI